MRIHLARGSRLALALVLLHLVGGACDTIAVVAASGQPSRSVDHSCVVEVLSRDNAVLQVIPPAGDAIAAAHLRIPEEFDTPSPVTTISVDIGSTREREVRTYTAWLADPRSDQYKEYEQYVRVQVERINTTILQLCDR
jgi:hypothetical protein